MNTYTKIKRTTFFICIFLLSLLTYSQNDEKKSKDDSSDKEEEKEKVKSGEISKSRYDSYIQIINDDNLKHR